MVFVLKIGSKELQKRYMLYLVQDNCSQKILGDENYKKPWPFSEQAFFNNLTDT